MTLTCEFCDEPVDYEEYSLLSENFHYLEPLTYIAHKSCHLMYHREVEVYETCGGLKLVKVEPESKTE